jgi:hypothetical protein
MASSCGPADCLPSRLLFLFPGVFFGSSGVKISETRISALINYFWLCPGICFRPALPLLSGEKNHPDILSKRQGFGGNIGIVYLISDTIAQRRMIPCRPSQSPVSVFVSLPLPSCSFV